MTDKKLAMLGIVSAFMLGACGQSAPEAPAEQEAPAAAPAEQAAAAPDLAALLGARSEEDRARDGGRKPADVLGILGVTPGMDALDLIAAGGWYTAVLSAAVGDEGSVTAQNPGWMHAFRDGAITAGIDTRISGGLSNVSKLDNEWTDLAMMEAQYDVALSALNVHDVYFFEGADGAAQFATAVYNVLKPGGVFGVIEHVGNVDGDNEALHRLPRDLTIEIITAAGFELTEDSDLLANPADDHTQSVFADGLRGNTDRFLLKFTKPAM
ncbi:MAG: class I SAM-dependent methyltransferase [Woeseiaceae bacterium]